ncbi:hypothetical protein JW964_04750 [candidate division KSB1 bacterium]|nr:hypothetical protein [candidate division KSB1 bacterium]
MNESETEKLLFWFTNLEDRFLEIIKYIPTDRNLQVDYPILASIIVEAGSLIDTVFHKEYPLQCKPKKTKLNIELFANYYEKQLNLSSIKTIPFLYPPRYLMPFNDWSDNQSNKYKSVIWWQNYNALKHDRIQQSNKATLETALLILSAFQQLISQLNSFLPTLIRYNMFSSSPGHDIKHILKAIKDQNTYDTVIIESKIFATTLGYHKFPDDISKYYPYFDGYSSRLINFLGHKF